MSMATVDELNTLVGSLQAQLAALNVRVAAAEGRAGEQDSNVAPDAFQPIKIVPQPAGAVAPIKTLADVPHDPTNPIPRGPASSIVPCLLDLAMDRGYIAVQATGNRSMMFEYQHHGSYLSRLYDLNQKFKAFLAKDTITPEDRDSLCILLTLYIQVASCITKRLDFLKVLGEKGASDPGMVYALEGVIAGSRDLPISSPDLLDTVKEYRQQVVKQALKIGAGRNVVARQENVGYRGRGRGGGRFGRGRGGRGSGQSQPQAPGGGVQTRNQAAISASTSQS